MKNSITLLSIFMLILVSNVSAQTPSKVVWGEPFLAGKERKIVGFVSQSDEAYFFIKKNGLDYRDSGTLTKLDENFNWVAQRPVVIPRPGKYAYLNDATATDDKASIILRKQDDESSTVISQEFDDRTLEMTNGMTTMADSYSHYVGPRYKNADYGAPMQDKSEDLSKRVFTNIGSNFSAESVSFRLSVCNDENEIMYSTEIKTEYPARRLYRLAMTVGNDGTSYVLARIVSGEKKDINSEVKIWKYNPDGSSDGEVSISLPEKYISNIEMKIAPDGSLICAGFYSYLIGHGANGTVFFQIDPTDLSVTTKKLEDFDATLLGLSSAVKKINGFYRVRVLGPFILDNGNTVVGMERYSGTSEPIISSDLIAFEFDSIGVITNTALIRKDQHSGASVANYSSCQMFSKGNRVFAVYNDAEINTKVPAHKIHSACKASKYNPTIIAELTASGFVKEVVCFNKEEKMRVSILDIKQNQDGDLIFMQTQNSSQSQMRFGKLEL